MVSQNASHFVSLLPVVMYPYDFNIAEVRQVLILLLLDTFSTVNKEYYF